MRLLVLGLAACALILSSCLRPASTETPQQAVSRLILATETADAGALEAALAELRELAAQDTSVINPLVMMLRVRDPEPWQLAEVSPLMSGDSAVLLNALGSADPDVRLHAMYIAGRRLQDARYSRLHEYHIDDPRLLPHEVVEQMTHVALQALSGTDPALRRHALSLLRYVPDSGAHVEAVLTAVGDHDPSVREEAVESLGFMGVWSDQVISAILTAFDDGYSYVRAAASGAAWRLGRQEPLIREMLIRGLDDPITYVRFSSAHALIAFRDDPDSVLPALLKAATDEECSVRRSAFFSMSALTGAAGIEGRLESFLYDTLWPDRDRVNLAHGTYVKLLHAASIALEDTSPRVREEVMNLFGLMLMRPDDLLRTEALAALKKAMSDEAPRVRTKAAGILSIYESVHTDP